MMRFADVDPSAAPSPTGPSAVVGIRPPCLMLTSRALRLTTEMGFDPRSLSDVTWLVLGGPPPQSPGWDGATCWPAFNCPSYPAVEAALANLRSYPLPSLILYDQEAWDLTPARERRDPVAFVQRAADLVRNSRVRLGAAPALTLAQELMPGAGSPEAAYLNCGVIEPLARAVSLFHVQSQRLERQPPRFSAFVREVAERARTSHPGLVVTAGLSTNPTGPEVGLEQLVECIERTAEHVDGYWLNVPRPGRRCPHCRPENPGLATALLARLRLAHRSGRAGSDGAEITVILAG